MQLERKTGAALHRLNRAAPCFAVQLAGLIDYTLLMSPADSTTITDADTTYVHPAAMQPHQPALPRALDPNKFAAVREPEVRRKKLREHRGAGMASFFATTSCRELGLIPPPLRRLRPCATR